MDHYDDVSQQTTGPIDDSRTDGFSDDLNENGEIVIENNQMDDDSVTNTHGTSSPGGSRIPYKSFRKKYQKMNLQFQEAIKRNEQLYSKELVARRIFNKILREKNTLLDILGALNSSEHFPDQLKIKMDRIQPASNDFQNKEDLNEDALFQLDLQDLAFEYSSDEENAPREENPMDLIPWLKRNQPQVFAESLERSSKEERQVSKKRKSDGTVIKDLKPKRSKPENETLEEESFIGPNQSTFSVDMSHNHHIPMDFSAQQGANGLPRMGTSYQNPVPPTVNQATMNSVLPAEIQHNMYPTLIQQPRQTGHLLPNTAPMPRSTQQIPRPSAPLVVNQTVPHPQQSAGQLPLQSTNQLSTGQTTSQLPTRQLSHTQPAPPGQHLSQPSLHSNPHAFPSIQSNQSQSIPLPHASFPPPSHHSEQDG